MTQREREIIDLLKENPFLSQKELASLLGIERSSIAVHLSNLMKKGIIKGKGYVIEDDAYVLVIGGANMDIVGLPTKTLLLADSNPGQIRYSHGGVARNIAENLSRLGVSVKLITALGQDRSGQELFEHCQQVGIDMAHSLLTHAHKTSTYLSVLDAAGDMHVAISDMSITDTLTVEYLQQKASLIERATYVIVDTNLSDESLDYLLTNFPDNPFILDTVSSHKAIKAKPLMKHLTYIKPNLLEAEILLDKKLNTSAEITCALKDMLTMGILFPMISLGAEGLAYLKDDHLAIMPPQITTIVNANGAGDAFLAGFVYGLMKDLSHDICLKLATQAASLTLSVETTLYPHLTEQRLIASTGGLK